MEENAQGRATERKPAGRLRVRLRRASFLVACVAAGYASLAALAAAACTSSSDDSAAFDGSSTDSSLIDGAPVDSQSSNGETSLRDVGSDGSTLDASTDAETAVDAAPGCVPTSISGFVPNTMAPTVDFPTSGCSNADFTQAWSACLGDASTIETCGTFADGGASSSCIACLFGIDDSQASGALIVGPVPVPDLSGCIEFADPSDAGQACAVALSNAEDCVYYACQPSCPVTDDPSRAAYISCTNSAAATVCATYTQAAATCIALERDASPEATYDCLRGATPAEQFENLASYFCAN